MSRIMYIVFPVSTELTSSIEVVHILHSSQCFIVYNEQGMRYEVGEMMNSQLAKIRPENPQNPSS